MQIFSVSTFSIANTMMGTVAEDNIREINQQYDMVLATSDIVSQIGDGQGNHNFAFSEIFTMAEDVTLDEENNGIGESTLSETQDSRFPLLKYSWLSCLRRRSWQEKTPTWTLKEGTISHDIPSDSCNFSCCPSEVRIHIFRFLSETQLIIARMVCSAWKHEIDSEVLSVSTALTQEKCYKYINLPKKKLLRLHVEQYTILSFEKKFTDKLYQRLPPPKSLHFVETISSKNFGRIVNAWRNIQKLRMDTHSLLTKHLFWDWKIEYPLDYFPRLEYLALEINRLKLNDFVPRILRYNLDVLLINPYEHLRKLSYRMLNVGHHYPCAFLAPVLMLIGRVADTIKEVDCVFHTGMEMEIPIFTNHAPTNFSPVLDQMYVHGENNLTRLQRVNLKSLKLRIPGINGCRTRAAVCDYFSKLIQCQQELKELEVETEMGIRMEMIHNLLTVNGNSRTLKVLDVTLSDEDFRRENTTENVPDVVKPLNLSIFGFCVSLHTLRLKRVGACEHTAIPHIHCIDQLPPSLEKLFLTKLNITWKDLYGIIKGLSNLKCLFIDRCDILGNIWKNEEFISRILIAVCFHNSLKFFSFCPVRKKTIHEICLRLSDGEETAFALVKLGWKWFLISKEFGLSHSRKLIFHKGREHCKHVWFETYIYDQIQIT